MSSHFNEPIISDAPGERADSAKEQGHNAGLQSKQTKMSNLTKNLLSSNSTAFAGAKPQDTHLGSDLPSYSASVDSDQLRTKGALNAGTNNIYSTTTPQYQQTNTGQPSSFTNNNQSQFVHGSMSYIPVDHNTPTVVSTSYSSNHSVTPSYQGNFVSQPAVSYQFVGSFKPGDATSSAIPTTNISMESANPSNSFNSVTPDQADTSSSHQRYTNSFPGGAFGQQTNFNNFRPQLNTLPSIGGRPSSSSPVYNASSHIHQIPSKRSSQTFSFAEADHYMSYKEFFDNLANKDIQNSGDSDNGYEDHLNIVEFPVNDLIEMLSCLLTKIIEANDKLHPNHFENTVAIRQRMKQEKKLKKFGEGADQKGMEDDDKNTPMDSDDEDDEMKNKYLANVLAFHGTNVPGISLHAYLARVLKYCPVTNEVFLSLLVYFDRIAKKANNLKNSEKENPDTGVNSSSEQLFVMDSYNIHRLIISGITVSSKFFSDIFYKNLRYAKVGGLPLEELNYLELQFLLLLDFKLMISVEDLQNYGDLLLRFWKREQLTNEIVNNPSKQMPENISQPTH